MAFLGLICLALMGCTKPNQTGSAVTPAPAQKRETILISHDFGLVGPNRKVHHVFSLRNQSTEPWTVAGIKDTCQCTASRSGAKTIEPGKALEVDVEYTSPATSKNDIHQVGVEFAEAGVPYYWLEVRASVREPLTLNLPGLLMEADVAGEIAQGELIVISYLDHDSKAPQATPSASWLSAEVDPVPVPAYESRGRQAWKLLVRVDTVKLQPGKHLAQIDLKSDDPQVPVKSVPIQLDLTPALEILPGSLSFGKVAAGKTVERKVLLKQKSKSEPVNLAELKIEHDLGERLKVTSKQLSEKVLVISVAFTPAVSDKKGNLQGALKFTFPEGGASPFQLPISAEIQQSR